MNLASQANMSPGQAATLWNSLVAPLASKGIELIGPSITTAPDGLNWMQEFFTACATKASPTCGVCSQLVPPA